MTLDLTRAQAQLLNTAAELTARHFTFQGRQARGISQADLVRLRAAVAAVKLAAESTEGPSA